MKVIMAILTMLSFCFAKDVAIVKKISGDVIT